MPEQREPIEYPLLNVEQGGVAKTSTTFNLAHAVKPEDRTAALLGDFEPELLDIPPRVSGATGTISGPA